MALRRASCRLRPSGIVDAVAADAIVQPARNLFNALHINASSRFYVPTMPTMPPASTPLYGHSLPTIEAWLTQQGCDRDSQDPSLWEIKTEDWSAKLFLDVDSIVVTYTKGDRSTVQRSFKYSLSRSDLEQVIFTGP